MTTTLLLVSLLWGAVLGDSPGPMAPSEAAIVPPSTKVLVPRNLPAAIVPPSTKVLVPKNLPAATVVPAAVGLLDLVLPTTSLLSRPALPPDSLRTLLSRAGQHLVVVTETAASTRGWLFRMERVGAGSAGEADGEDLGPDGKDRRADREGRRAAGGGRPAVGDGKMRRVGPPIPVVVGRAGVGPKKEGDGRSPRGVFRLGPAFGYAPRAPEGVALPYVPMEPGAVCVDDPTSDHYNRVLTGDGLPPPAERDWAGAEAMRRDLAHGDDLYQWGIVVRYNGIEVEDGSGDPGPGAGSCIFLHIWRGPERPTVGCTAMARADLLTVLRWLTADARPVLIQGDRAWLEELRREGTLFYPVPGAGALSTMMKSPVPAGTRMDGGSEGPRTACSCPVPAGTGMGERPAACPS